MQKLPLFISILRTSFIANKTFATVPVNRIIALILRLFIQHGLVSSVEQHGSYLKVYLNYKYPLRTLTYIGPTRKQKWKSARFLRKLNCHFALISTSQGILSLVEVQKLNLGGIILIQCDFNI